MGWKEGVEAREVPLVSELTDRYVRQRVVEGGRPTQVVTKVDANRFADVWLDTVTGKKAAPRAVRG